MPLERRCHLWWWSETSFEIFIVKVYISRDPFGEFGSLKNLGSGEISWIPTSLSAQEGESLGVRHHEKQHILKPVPNEGCEAVVEKLRQNAKKKMWPKKKKKGYLPWVAYSSVSVCYAQGNSHSEMDNLCVCKSCMLNVGVFPPDLVFSRILVKIWCKWLIIDFDKANKGFYAK